MFAAGMPRQIRPLHGSLFAGFLILSALVTHPTSVADEAPPLLPLASSPSASTPTTQVLVSAEAPPATDALARSLLLANLPREYENSKQWGQTRRRWNGLDVSLDGLRLDTKRRWKEVNHGTWTRYRAWLIAPERELQVHFQNLRRADTKAAAFDLTVDARLGSEGRLSEWNRGVQLYSFSAEAEGKIRLQLTCELDLQLDGQTFPPGVILSPQVTDAKLDLLEFRLHRISDADGPLVRKLGDSLRREIEAEIQERRAKLVEKLNRAIEKNRDHLRLSASDLIASGWGKLVPTAAIPASEPAPFSAKP